MHDAFYVKDDPVSGAQNGVSGRLGNAIRYGSGYLLNPVGNAQGRRIELDMPDYPGEYTDPFHEHYMEQVMRSMNSTK